MNKDDLKRIVDAGDAARRELRKMEDAEEARDNAKLVGRCYRYRNCYSCPETDADYWWSYTKITGLDEDGLMIAFSFDTDKNGHITIDPAKRYFKPFDGYQPCDPEVFDTEWEALLEKLAALQ